MNRAVVTGIGVLAANGNALEEFWQSLLECRSGIGPITLFDPTGLTTTIAGEIRDFSPLDFIEPSMKPQRMSRCTQLAVAAARMAIDNAQLYEQMQLEKHYLETLVASSQTGIVVIDAEGRILSWNPAAEKIFGYTSTEAIGPRRCAPAADTLMRLERFTKS